MLHPTIDKLRRLRLIGMAKALEEQLAQPDSAVGSNGGSRELYGLRHEPYIAAFDAVGSIEKCFSLFADRGCGPPDAMFSPPSSGSPIVCPGTSEPLPRGFAAIHPCASAVFERIAGAAQAANHVVVAMRAQRLTQPADVHIDSAQLDMDVPPPDPVQKLLPREHPVGPLHQQAEQPELGRAEVNVLAASCDPIRCEIHDDLAAGQPLLGCWEIGQARFLKRQLSLPVSMISQ